MISNPNRSTAPPPVRPPPGAQAAAPGFPFARLAPHLVAGLLGLAALGSPCGSPCSCRDPQKPGHAGGAARTLYPWHWGGGSLDARGLAWGALAVSCSPSSAGSTSKGLSFTSLSAPRWRWPIVSTGAGRFRLRIARHPRSARPRVHRRRPGLLLALLAVRAWRRRGLAPKAVRGRPRRRAST